MKNDVDAWRDDPVYSGAKTMTDTPKPSAKFLWIDVETTGLDPDNDKLLEVAWMVTDAKLSVLASGVQLAEDRGPWLCNATIAKMHGTNGLFAELEAGPRTPDVLLKIQERLHGVIRDFAWDERKPILAGSSVHFDRGFLPKSVRGELHHRHLDVSAVALALGILGYVKPSSGGAHRAMADVLESIELLRHALGWIHEQADIACDRAEVDSLDNYGGQTPG